MVVGDLVSHFLPFVSSSSSPDSRRHPCFRPRKKLAVVNFVSPKICTRCSWILLLMSHEEMDDEKRRVAGRPSAPEATASCVG